MTRNVIATAVLSVATLAFGVGCHDNDRHASKESNSPVPPPSKVANRMTAKEKLADAEAAEKAGNYSRALEAYDQLRSYPEAARPKDLDARIARVEAKMKK